MSSRKSHPPTLITHVRRALRDECELKPGDTLLVAVSGGGDSQALLHALAHCARRSRIQLVAHGVDHGLRAESSAELDLAQALAEALHIPFGRTRVSLKAGANLMARAREARWSALLRAAERAGAGAVATAHHADDRAETVLLRLLRGAGPRGLAVLPARDGARLRPLIRARRADVSAHLERHRLAYASDPSNHDRRFLRVRVREEVLPLLENLSPNVVEHLNALADQLTPLRASGLLEVLDDQGQPLSLGRAQMRQVQKLLATRSRRARVHLPGGWVAKLGDNGQLAVDPPSSAPFSGKRSTGRRRLQNLLENDPANPVKSD